MDLTTAAVNFQQGKTLAAIQMRVARKIMDMQQLQGAAVIKLIDAAAKVATSSGDALVAAATGLGSQLDIQG
jgi:hypothetical protein